MDIVLCRAIIMIRACQMAGSLSPAYHGAKRREMYEAPSPALKKARFVDEESISSLMGTLALSNTVVLVGSVDIPGMTQLSEENQLLQFSKILKIGEALYEQKDPRAIQFFRLLDLGVEYESNESISEEQKEFLKYVAAAPHVILDDDECASHIKTFEVDEIKEEEFSFTNPEVSNFAKIVCSQILSRLKKFEFPSLEEIIVHDSFEFLQEYVKLELEVDNLWYQSLQEPLRVMKSPTRSFPNCFIFEQSPKREGGGSKRKR